MAAQNQVYPGPPPPGTIQYAPPPNQTTVVYTTQQPPPPHGQVTYTTQQQPGQVVMTHQPVAPAPKPTFGEESTRVFCPNCQTEVLTELSYVHGNMTYITAIMCIIFGGVLGCCLIPFFLKEFKDVNHTCPTCQSPLGKYKRG